MPSFADTHVHFHFPDFDPDREAAIQRARDAGVRFFVNIGTDVASSKSCLALAEAYPDFYASAGIHPHEAKTARDEDFSALEELLKHPRVVAIGEVGLDFFRDHSPKTSQIGVFERFLDLHRKVQKPLIIHCRDAYAEMHSLMKQHKPPFRGVMHCYSSDQDTMRSFLDLGFHISFAGPLTYKKNQALREACRACPIDRLHFETDAPYLPPEPYRGKRNESAYMVETLKTAADLRGMSLETLGEQVTQNARHLFGL